MKVTTWSLFGEKTWLVCKKLKEKHGVPPGETRLIHAGKELQQKVEETFDRTLQQGHTYVYVTGSEKTTLIATFLAIERKAYIRSVVCNLFQARSPFSCEVMIANAGAVPLRLT